MTNLDALRRLKRDPAAFGVTRDPSGHTFSPSLKAQQREVDEKFKEADALATKAKAEFEQRYAQGFALREVGDDEAALEQFAAAYILAREMNYRAGEADALNMTGVCYKHQGELERAASVFEGCAQICASMKDPQAEAAALGNLGQALAAQKRLAEAEAAHERSLELARSGGSGGDGHGGGSSGGGAGGGDAAASDSATHLHGGDSKHDTGAAAAANDDKSGELSALFHLGTLRLRMQRFEEAEVALAAAQTIAVALGDKAAEVGVLQRLAAARDILQQQQQQQQQQHRRPTPPAATNVGAADGAASASSSTAGASSTPAGSASKRSPARPTNRFALKDPPTPPQDLSASLPARSASLLAREPPRDLGASLPQKDVGVPSLGADARHSLLPPPLPPLEGEKQPPLALLVRAEKLTREIGKGGEPLRMQVLRQLRAQYEKIGNGEGTRACEKEIDALFAKAKKLHDEQQAELRRRREAIESVEVEVARVEISEPQGSEEAKDAAKDAASTSGGAGAPSADGVVV